MAYPKIFALIDKACFDYNLIQNGDKILVGASGGKDSTALIEYLANRKKRPNENFDFTALNIQSDFALSFPDGILNLFADWKVDFKSINLDVLKRLKPGRKMNCWWCSTQRRKELLDFALKNNYNKIALGHHLDDVLETVLMNVLNKGELSTMPPILPYKNYPGVSIIRPLYYCSEKTLIQTAKDENYFGFTCTCDYQNNSERKTAKHLLEQLTQGDENKKQKMLRALKNIYPEYLP